MNPPPPGDEQPTPINSRLDDFGGRAGEQDTRKLPILDSTAAKISLEDGGVNFSPEKNQHKI